MRFTFPVSKIVKNIILFIGCIFMYENGFAQQSDSLDKWDNQAFLSNKAAWSKGDWRYTGELQVRFDSNARRLDQYFLEGVVTYMYNKNWEFSPDLRITVYRNKFEIRPGFGTYFKQYWGSKYKNQLVHQAKYQLDIEDGGVFKQGMRYIIFHNLVLNDKLLISSAAGGFYRWSERFTGLQFARAMTGLAFSFDKQHIFSLSYFVGAENQGEYWSYIGGPIIQLVIRFDDNFKYVPAKYISF